MRPTIPQPVKRIYAVALFFAVSLGLSFAQTPAESSSGVEGVITVSPIRGGPDKIGVPNSAPLAHTAFVIKNEQGTVATFTTDAEGQFRVSLAPGHYTVSTQQPAKRIGRYGPFELDVTAGKTTRVKWDCDSGMR
jgi:hypothetical protein